MFWIGSRLAGLVHRKGRRCFVCALCYWLLPPIALSLCYNVTLLLCYCVTVLQCYFVTDCFPPFLSHLVADLAKGRKEATKPSGTLRLPNRTEPCHEWLGTEQFKLWAGMLVPWLGCLDKYASNNTHTVCQVQKLEPPPGVQVNTFQVARWENGSGRRVRCSSRFPVRWKHVLTCGVLRLPNLDVSLYLFF